MASEWRWARVQLIEDLVGRITVFYGENKLQIEAL